ncbi:hypothetical protein HOY82DRAFT_652579 [Tuber indicum]|nr:hypothetical protein HOY82DRAFT_652579 [Tuber indicum]
MSTNKFRNHESYKFKDDVSPLPSPICRTKLPQVSASEPVLDAWNETVDLVGVMPLTEGTEDARVYGCPGPSARPESFMGLSGVSPQDLNRGTPSIAPTGATGTGTGTTAIVPPSIGDSGQPFLQLPQGRGSGGSGSPAPLFYLVQHSEPATHIAPSSVNASCSIWPFAVLANIPYLVMFSLDIVGTHYRGSKFYRQNLDLRFGTPGPIIFQLFYIIVGFGTALANIMFLGTFIDCVSLKWGKDKIPSETESGGVTRKPPFGKGRTLRGPGVLVLVGGVILGVLVFVAGPIVAAFVAVRTHTLPPLVPVSALCSDFGYETTIMLQALDSETANSTNWGGAPLYSSATFYSGSMTPFTMDLMPHNGPRYTFPSSYLFVFNPAGIHENDLIALSISNVSVGYDLGNHTYEFRYDRGQGGPELVDQGNMHDDPYDAESLSFTQLPRPIYSMARYSWVSYTLLAQPQVPFVRGLSIATDIAQQTELDFLGAVNCTTVKMCARDSIAFMLTDSLTFESMLVPVGRFLIEVARFAEDYCKLDKFE